MDLRIFKMYKEDNVHWLDVKSYIKKDFKNGKEILDEIKQKSKTNKITVLVNMKKVNKIGSMVTRTLAEIDIHDSVKSIAFLFNQPITEEHINFITNIHYPQIKIRVFGNKEKAISWLSEN